VNLAEFVDRFRDALTGAVLRTYPPLYDAAARQAMDFGPRQLLRRTLGGQADAIRAAVLSLHRHPGTSVVGEMGTGKSLIAAAAAYLAGFRRVFVLCPPHLVKKWQREIVQTVPGAAVGCGCGCGAGVGVAAAGLSGGGWVGCGCPGAPASAVWAAAVVRGTAAISWAC